MQSSDASPARRGAPEDVPACLKCIEDVYVTDAYHSLSIEGYRVSPALNRSGARRRLESGPQRGPSCAA